jgi:hypothetical protein
MLSKLDVVCERHGGSGPLKEHAPHLDLSPRIVPSPHHSTKSMLQNNAKSMCIIPTVGGHPYHHRVHAFSGKS